MAELFYKKAKWAYVIIIFLSTTCPHIAASEKLLTVVLSDTPPPETLPGVFYSAFFAPSLNKHGDVAYSANILGTGVTGANNFGIWKKANSNDLEFVARKGQPAPGITNTAKFIRLTFTPSIDDDANVAFSAELPNHIDGFWRESVENGLEAIVVGSTSIIGVDPNSLISVHTSSRNTYTNSGLSVFQASWISSTQDEFQRTNGLWSELDNNEGLKSIVLSGNSAPGTEEETFFDFNDPFLLHSVNDYGQIAFTSRLGGPLISETNNSGIWVYNNEKHQSLIVREGSKAPGIDTDAKFIVLYSPIINNHGQVIFEAIVEGTNINNSISRGVWIKRSENNLSLVAQAGDQAPGTSIGTKFSSPNTPLLSDSGEVIFRSFLSGNDLNNSNDSGIWKGRSSESLTIVAREGDPAPGAPPGVTFNSNRFNSSSRKTAFTSVSINAGGQVAFAANVDSRGSISTLGSGIWAEDVRGNLKLIAVTGGLLDVSDNPLLPDLREVASVDLLGFSGNSDGIASGFNDRGQLAFTAAFKDGSSGIFVSNLVAIPEPRSLMLIVLGFCILLTQKNSSPFFSRNSRTPPPPTA